MPFEKVSTQAVDFPALERAVLRFWAERGIFEQRKALNQGKPTWSFLDGPITANNPMGVHHAWNRTYKDAFNRYYSMRGRELRYQQGFDCQGLWVEVEVEKELKLQSKRDIETLVPGDPDASLDCFVTACKNRVDQFARIQTEQSIRLGYWMNWDQDEDWSKPPGERHSYFTMSEQNNYAIWDFLKRCHDKKRVTRGYDVMPWCGRCGVGISEMELKEGYRFIEHRAAFVKFPLRDRPGENLLAWTTTPWTLSSNVAAAVNPELTYVKVQLRGEIYYIGKQAYHLNRMAGSSEETETPGKKGQRDWLDGVPPLSSLAQMFKSKAAKEAPPEIIGEVQGADLIGWRYSGPFDELEAQNIAHGYPREVAEIGKSSGWFGPETGAAAHRVIAWSDVSESEGTGIVHIAPGCGGEDFHLGRENHLPAIAPLDESGTFLPGFGPMAGLRATDPATADVVFEQLKQSGKLFSVERYAHRYPHCWRCKTELLYRLVDEWFIEMGPQHTEEGFRGEIMHVVEKVKFLPESLNGRAREYDWLWNMGNWMISKKRYWGLSLPIWVDELDPTQFEVIGSRDELQSRAIEGWDEFDGQTPHRPWIDKVVLRNPRTGNKMYRVPDVGNPWLDAGIVAFSTLNYKTDPDYWRKWYPADFITESFPGQFRNWFYALLALSTEMGNGEPPFKTLLGFATVKDQTGRDMHKSEGNSIEFIAAADTGFQLKHRLEKNKSAALPEGAISYIEIEMPDPVTKQMVPAIEASYPPIGADVMRWLYCRQNPVQNLNFGPVPTNEVRRQFHIKLWNCYAMFCNYAALDGYDPAAGIVPSSELPAVDRWILGELNTLVATANEAFQNYKLMDFALAAEEFVDGKLSNWYLRVNRDRLWSQNAKLDDAGRRDKSSVYQTLYDVLRTLSQLLAPCVPFLAETLWQNLRVATDVESVHLTDYPQPGGAADPALARTMAAVIQVVALGHAARNAAGKPVKQALASLAVAPDDEWQANAVIEFGELIREQLNVKALALHQLPSPLLTPYAKLNKKTAAAKLGPKLKDAERELATADITKLEVAARDGMVKLAGVELNAGDFQFTHQAAEGFAGASERGLQVALDTRLTPELRAEGLARGVVRRVQEARKAAALDIADKIRLDLRAEGELAAAIEAHRATIADDVQALEWGEVAGETRSDVVEGHVLGIRLAKLEPIR